MSLLGSLADTSTTAVCTSNEFTKISSRTTMGAAVHFQDKDQQAGTKLFSFLFFHVQWAV
jgi:hypothetical protein